MFQSKLVVRHGAQAALCVPFALLVGSCTNNDEAPIDQTGGASGSGASSSTGGSSGTGANGGSSGSNAGVGGNGAAAGAGGSGGGAADTSRLGPPVVLLGAAGNFVILAKTAVANTTTSAITGDLGLSPAAASYITGFAKTRAGTKWTDAQVVGDIFAADNDPPTPTDLTTAVSNMEAAYTDAAGRTTPDFTNLATGAIGGLTLAPGLYNWTSAVTIPTDVTIAGAPNDVWIFQVAGDLALSAAKSVTLNGGARAKNIFWQVGGTVDLGTTSHFEGIILSQTSITLETGASINGRLLAQTAVNVSGATVTEPAQ